MDPSGSKWIRLLPGILTAIVGRYDVFGDRTFILGGHTQSPSGSEWIRPDLSESERIWNVDCDCRPLFGDRTFILVRSYPVPTHSICMTVVVPSDHSESTRRELSTVSPSRPWSGIRIAAPGWSAYQTLQNPLSRSMFGIFNSHCFGCGI